MADHYSRREVARMLGVTEPQLNYWERLRLVRPETRQGRRVYGFRDLIALRTIQQLVRHRVPMSRLRRALAALERQMDVRALHLSALRALALGRQPVLVPPGPRQQPLAPLTGQYVLDFDARDAAGKLREMAPRTAQEWLETGRELDADPETLPRAAEAYARAVELAPEWLDAQLSLGTVLYQLDRLGEAAGAFRTALGLHPNCPEAHFNLGCVLGELGELPAAIEHLKETAQLAPRSADAQMQLALAFEKQGDNSAARRHWVRYLRLESEGPWADYARNRLGRPRPLGRAPGTTPFRRSE